MNSKLNVSGSVTGSFHLQIHVNGVLVEDYIDNNLVVNLGKKNVARLLGGDSFGKKITKVQAGTNGTAPALTDSGITNPFTKALTSVTYPNDNEVAFNWILEANEANGMTISEFGLLNEDNILFARKTRTPIQKVAPMVITGIWKITIN